MSKIGGFDEGLTLEGSMELCMMFRVMVNIEWTQQWIREKEGWRKLTRWIF